MPPTPSLDSVQIQNTTGLAIVVTVRLMVSDNQQPSITETIPVQGNTIATFNFGTATNDFMTMNVSRRGRGPRPAAVDEHQPVAATQWLRRDPVHDLLIRSLLQRQRPLIPGLIGLTTIAWKCRDL